MRTDFPVREKSEFGTYWKSQENEAKYWKTQEISDICYLLFLVIFKCTVYYLLKWIMFSGKKQNSKKNTGKWGKIWEKLGNFGN